MHRNLVRMVEMSHDAGASVLLLGVRLPANYGNRCGDRFRQVYRDVASETGAPWVDFFLEGVAETTALMQADGIHPPPPRNRATAHSRECLARAETITDEDDSQFRRGFSSQPSPDNAKTP